VTFRDRLLLPGAFFSPLHVCSKGRRTLRRQFARFLSKRCFSTLSWRLQSSDESSLGPDLPFFYESFVCRKKSHLRNWETSSPVVHRAPILAVSFFLASRLKSHRPLKFVLLPQRFFSSSCFPSKRRALMSLTLPFIARSKPASGSFSLSSLPFG